MPPASRPAKITPQSPGEWCWVGTRVPMATQFQVEVQADKPLNWTFATPPPHLKISYPSRGKTNLRPVLFLEFNQ